MKTTYLRNAIAQQVVGIPGYEHGGHTSYLGLLEEDPTVSGDQTYEVSGGSYARQSISWGSPNEGIIANDTQIDFTDMPDCTIKYWAVFDASTNGNMLFYGRFPKNLLIESGQDLEILEGNLKHRET